MDILLTVILTSFCWITIFGVALLKVKLTWQDSAHSGVESFAKLLAAYANDRYQKSVSSSRRGHYDRERPIHFYRWDTTFLRLLQVASNFFHPAPDAISTRHVLAIEDK